MRTKSENCSEKVEFYDNSHQNVDKNNVAAVWHVLRRLFLWVDDKICIILSSVASHD